MYALSQKTREAKKKLEEIRTESLTGKELLKNFLQYELKSKFTIKNSAQAIMDESQEHTSNIYKFATLLDAGNNMVLFKKAIELQAVSRGTTEKGLFCKLIYNNRNNWVNSKSKIKTFLLAKEASDITAEEDKENIIEASDRRSRRMKNVNIAEKLKSKRLSNVLKVFIALVMWNYILIKESTKNAGAVGQPTEGQEPEIKSTEEEVKGERKHKKAEVAHKVSEVTEEKAPEEETKRKNEEEPDHQEAEVAHKVSEVTEEKAPEGETKRKSEEEPDYQEAEAAHNVLETTDKKRQEESAVEASESNREELEVNKAEEDDERTETEAEIWERVRAMEEKCSKERWDAKLEETEKLENEILEANEKATKMLMERAKISAEDLQKEVKGLKSGTKLSAGQALAKYKSLKDAVSYLILVECYENYLSGDQKNRFLDAATIDEMINTLNDKQFKHLESMVNSFYWMKRDRGIATNYSKGLASDWFLSNIRALGKESHEEYCRIVTKDLIKRIKNIWKARDAIQGYTKDVIAKYKERLKRFDGDSVEYRQWLMLMADHPGIPFIEKTYNVETILRHMTLEMLNSYKDDIENAVEEVGVGGYILRIKYLEPYYYLNAVSKLTKIDAVYTIRSVRYQPVLTNYSVEDFILKNKLRLKNIEEGKAFETAIKLLEDKIDKIIKEKEEDIGYTLDNLVSSESFFEDVYEIFHSMGSVDEAYLKNVIGEYSNPAASGGAFNRYLRCASLLKKLSKSDVAGFRNKILKVYKYFENHLTDNECTVYRGMGANGLVELINTSSNPKINIKLLKPPPDSYRSKIEKYEVMNYNGVKSVIGEINTKKPVVYDLGFGSTSVNSGVSANRFLGKKDYNVFFTIKVPKGSRALVLDYEGVSNIPYEEEMLLAPRTRMRINSIEEVGKHFEVQAEVLLGGAAT